MVNEDRMRHTFEDLVKIDAPSKGEREVCDYLKKKLIRRLKMFLMK